MNRFRHVAAIAGGAISLLGYGAFAVLTTRWLDPVDRGFLLIGMTTAGMTTVLASLGLTVTGRSKLADGLIAPAEYIRPVYLALLLHQVVGGLVGAAVALLVGLDLASFTAFVLLYGTANLCVFLLREGTMGLGRVNSALAGEVGYVGALIMGVIALQGLGLLRLAAVLQLTVATTAIYAIVQAAMFCPNVEVWLTRPRAADATMLVRSWRSLAFFVAEFALTRWDRIIVGIILGPSASTYYGAAATYGQLSALPVQGGRQIYYRLVSRGSHRVGQARAALFMLVALGSAVLAVAAPLAVPLLFGAGFSEIVPASALAAVSGLVVAWYQLRRSAAAYHLEDARAFRSALAGLGLFVVMCWPAYAWQSWLGLVAAWVASVAVAGVLLGGSPRR